MHTESYTLSEVFSTVVALYNLSCVTPYKASHPQPHCRSAAWWVIFKDSLLLPQLYTSLWVLACSIIPLHGFFSCAFCFQLFTSIFLKSSLTSSSHLNLGLPFSLVACGFHLQMLLTTLSSGILSTCPTQLSLLLLMCLTIFSWLIRFSSSSFVFCLHSPFVFCVGPKILLNNLLLNTNNFRLMFPVNTQHSDPYTTTGLITVWYNLSLVFLVISLFWNIFFVCQLQFFLLFLLLLSCPHS